MVSMGRSAARFVLSVPLLAGQEREILEGREAVVPVLVLGPAPALARALVLR
jgi:hypothetical protein